MPHAVECAARGVAALADIGEPPSPTGSQVQIRTEFTGVTNGTERHALLAEHGYGGGVFPSRHGYQHIGVIEAVGDAVRRFTVGDRVFCGDHVGHRAWHIADENGLVVKLTDEAPPQDCALMGTIFDWS